MHLTPARLRVLDLLQDFRYLPAPYIGELLGYKGQIELIKGKEVWRCTYLREELKRLRDEHVIDAIKYPYRPWVYYLTEKGERTLKDRELYRSIEKTGEPFEDELGMCVVYASFIIGMNKHGVELIPWEEIGKPPYQFNVTFDYRKPDGATVNLTRIIEHDWKPFGMSHNDKALYVVGMERDMDTQGWAISKYKKTSVQHHFRGVLAASKNGIYKKALGVPNAWIPFIFSSKSRMEEGMDRFAEYTDEKGAQNVLFGYLPKYQSDEPYPLPTGWAFEQYWPRVCSEKNHEPFSFAKELGVI